MLTDVSTEAPHHVQECCLTSSRAREKYFPHIGYCSRIVDTARHLMGSGKGFYFHNLHDLFLSRGLKLPNRFDSSQPSYCNSPIMDFVSEGNDEEDKRKALAGTLTFFTGTKFAAEEYPRRLHWQSQGRAGAVYIGGTFVDVSLGKGQVEVPATKNVEVYEMLVKFENI